MSAPCGGEHAAHVFNRGQGALKLVDPSGTWRPIHATWGVTVQLNLDGQAPRHIVEEDEADTLSRASYSPGTMLTW